MGSITGFNPARFLTLVSGKEYLEVKWRLVWLRSDHPDAHIETEMVESGNTAKGSPYALFKATIQIPEGGKTTGYGMEDASGFGDYIEKAETKSIGRALAALGYGTQFTNEFVLPPPPPAPDPIDVLTAGMNDGSDPERRVSEDEAAAVRMLAGKVNHKGKADYPWIQARMQEIGGVANASELTISNANALASELATLLDA